MNEEQLIKEVAVAAIATVGFTQFLKNFFRNKPLSGNVWALVMVALAVTFTLADEFLPEWVTVAVLTVVVSQLFYETIFSALAALVNAVADRAKGVNLPAGSSDAKTKEDK